MNPAERFFVYIYCNDLAAMRDFYSRLLELREIFSSDGERGGLGYGVGNVQFTIFEAAEELPVERAWHRQPGWSGGVRATPSWSIQIENLEKFRAIVDGLIRANVPRFSDKPTWQGYWSFPVKDPMGNTVELTHAPEGKPGNPC